ncbi:hypothetical protein [Burkholderia ubonensis]|uniref:hypothetical protein n=2 Tax=Burkholderia ubonensis TaxID=101571 RepID=UPI0011609B98|nr:hypothetical protein [Burkholderia ubonensis]
MSYDLIAEVTFAFDRSGVMWHSTHLKPDAGGSFPISGSLTSKSAFTTRKLIEQTITNEAGSDLEFRWYGRDDWSFFVVAQRPSLLSETRYRDSTVVAKDNAVFRKEGLQCQTGKSAAKRTLRI